MRDESQNCLRKRLVLATSALIFFVLCITQIKSPISTRVLIDLLFRHIGCRPKVLRMRGQIYLGEIKFICSRIIILTSGIVNKINLLFFLLRRIQEGCIYLTLQTTISKAPWNRKRMFKNRRMRIGGNHQETPTCTNNKHWQGREGSQK